MNKGSRDFKLAGVAAANVNFTLRKFVFRSVNYYFVKLY